jgi:hypothetical protein
MPQKAEANEIMASALEAAAVAQEQGECLRVGEAYDRTFSRILETRTHYDDAVAFALTFWDEWLDAANHNWRYHGAVSPVDWLRFARQVARDVRRGAVPSDPELLERVVPKVRKRFPPWFRGLFGRAIQPRSRGAD